MWETMAPTIVSDASGIVGADGQGQHVYASLIMSTEPWTEARPIVARTPGENDLEAWRRMVGRFDPASAQENISLMSRIFKPPKGKVENMPLRFEKVAGYVWPGARMRELGIRLRWTTRSGQS